jgi:hypothetical protein
MGKVIKICDQQNEIYSCNCFVNTVIFRGKLPKEPTSFSGGVVKFEIQISGGKNEKGDWNPPIYADITAFGELAQRILKNYHVRDEIWIIGKYYTNVTENKTYRGFIAREIISEKEIKQSENELDDLPF